MENDDIKKIVDLFVKEFYILSPALADMAFGRTYCNVNDEDTKVLKDYYNSVIKKHSKET
jgi:hypothetical protein